MYRTIITGTVAIVLGIVIAYLKHDFGAIFGNFVKVENSLKKFPGVLSQEELASYNGVDKEQLYLALIGSVYDVTEGKKHYQKGGSYNYFIGKDGSRAFVTGNFKDESDDKDKVLDMSCNDLMALVDWRKTFKSKYNNVGVLIGRYFNSNGEETVYMKELKVKIKQCRLEKQMQKEEDIKFPPCNMSWDKDEGSKVWCTKTSGGQSRDWVGVPRQLFTPGIEKPRCVCIKMETNTPDALLKNYDNCSPTSDICFIPNKN